MKLDSKVITTGLGDIEYRSIGSGIPVVFVHGGHSNCKETLCHKGFDLEKFQLIVPSRLGYGRTPLIGNGAPRKSAELIAGLLDLLSVEPVIVYGISAGGPTAVALAANYPNRVRKLILASAVSKKWLGKNESTYKTANVIFHPKIEKLTWGMVRFFSKLFPRAMARSFYPQFSKHPIGRLEKEAIQELIFALSHYNSGQGFLNDIRQNLNANVLAKIKCPTLVIHSENDNSVPLSHAEHAHEMIANSRLEILKNKWGHLFWIGADSKGAIAKTIQFIDG